MYVIIDPGKTGAAVLMDGLKPVDAYGMREYGSRGIDVTSLRDTLLIWHDLFQFDRLWLEKISPRPGQGVQQTATQFFILGQTEAALLGLDADLVELWPQTWTSFTKRLSVDPTRESKKIAQELAKKYFPEFSAKWTPQTKVHDGVADCLCMSMYINRDHYVDELPAVEGEL